MELLRIVAIVLVMIVHASFLAIGVPTKTEAMSMPIPTFTRFLFQSISIVCVNVFVLISGWYGIKVKLNKILSLIFQTLFFSIFVYMVFLMYDFEKYKSFDYIGTIFLLHSNDYWFIKAYIGLFLLSPLLNSFISNSTEKQLRYFLLSFYLFQTIYGWLSIFGAQWFEGGYSAISFVGLYMLARYLRLYPIENLERNAKLYFILFFAIVLFQTVLAFCITCMGFSIAGRLFTYTNPVVILESVCLMLAFSKLKFQVKIINWIASSCLAIYLLHANELFLRPYYGKMIRTWFMKETTIDFWIYTISLMTVLFVTAILIDKVRLYIWNTLSRKISSDS